MLELERLLREHGERLDGQVAPVGMVELEQRIADDGTEIVQVVALEQAPSRRPGGRNGAVVGVAAAIVVASGLGLVVASRSHTDRPVETSPKTTLALEPTTGVTALGVAEAFMDSWIAGDGHAAVRLFNADGTYGAGVVALDQLPALHDWYRAVGWQFRDLGCRAESAATPNGEVVVNCTLTGDNDLGQALDWAPITDNFHLVVDGGLDRATERFGFDAYRDLWFTFKNWVAETHPDDLERMFLHPGAPWPGVRTATQDPPFEALNAYPLLNEDSITFWEQYVDEFITSTTAIARANEELDVARYVAEAVSLCTAADAEFAAEVAGLMQTETDNFQQYHVGFPDLQSQADWHDAQTGYADRVIAELASLPVPESIADDVAHLIALMEEETSLNREVAVAAAAADQSAVDTLTTHRVDATHAKDGLAFTIGYALYTCPVSSAGA